MLASPQTQSASLLERMHPHGPDATPPVPVSAICGRQRDKYESLLCILAWLKTIVQPTFVIARIALLRLRSNHGNM